MFIDLAKIFVKAGQGGSGACSFRREKHLPKGGPNGGDGGRGGSIILEVDPQIRTLIDFKYKKHYTARHGQHGMGKNRNGKDADDIVVKVPLGTVVIDLHSDEILADLVEPGTKFIAARGGKGGRGNARFATPTHQAPQEWEVGEAGEQHTLQLELKIIADVGLVGKPNAGKSTLLSSISAARPKIADYPFTTLEPNLGIVKVDDLKSYVVADIPGLIKGAHQGKGLGLKFLRHVERTRLLVCLIDPTVSDPFESFQILREELGKYSEVLIKKPFVVAFTKKDIWEERFIDNYKDAIDAPLFELSAISGEGIQEFKWLLWKKLFVIDKS